MRKCIRVIGVALCCLFGFGLQVNSYAAEVWRNLDTIIATHNLVLSTVQDINKAQLNLNLATAEFYPNLYIDYQLMRTENVNILPANQYQSSMQIKLETYLFKNGLSLFDNIGLKQKELELSTLGYQKTRQELKKECLALYLDYYLAFKNYELHNETLQFYEKTLNTTLVNPIGENYKLKSPVIQLEIDLQKDVIAQDELSLAALYLQLNQRFPKILEDSPTPDIKIEQFLTQGISTQNLTENLELKLLKQEIVIEEQKMKLQGSSAMPSLKLFFTKDYLNIQNSLAGVQAAPIKENGNIFGILVNLPLFDAKIGLNTEKQAAEKLKIFYKEQELRSQLRLRLQEKLALFIQNTKRYLFLKEKLIKAQENLANMEPLCQKEQISFIQYKEYYLIKQQISQRLFETEKMIFSSMLEIKQLTGEL